MSEQETIDALPASKVQRPKTIERSYQRLQRELGIGSGPVPADPDAEVYMPHAEFERQKHQAAVLADKVRDGYEEPTDCEGELLVMDKVDAGARWIVECSVCRFDAIVNMATADPERLQRELRARAGIPEMFAGREFDSTVPEQADTLRAVRTWLRGFKKEPIPALALYGRNGRGKSHLLALIAETLIKLHGVETLYMPEATFFDSIGGATPEADARWARYLRTPVLLLDDLGAGRMTEFRLDRLQALIDHRYSKELPLLIATNIPPVGWDRAFGARSASRLRGIALPFELRGEDRRTQPQMKLGADA